MFYIVVFLFGLAIGSFLNVVIYRIPRGESIVSPPSHCPHCDHGIRPWENIPLLSWLFLGGRCSHCKAPISGRYPLVELLTGLVFLAVFWRYGLTLGSLVYMWFSALLITITFVDLDHLIIPDGFLLLASLAGVISWFVGGTEVLIQQLIGAIALGGTFWAIRFFGEKIFKKEAMGFGDVKFAVLFGWTLGWQVGIVAAFLSFVAASALLLLLIPLKRIQFGQQIPFGPFIAIGTWAGLLFGVDLLNWYIGLVK